MQSTCSHSSVFFLLINVEIAKTIIGFLSFKILFGIMAFFFVDVIYNMTQISGFILVFLCNFGSSDPKSLVIFSMVFLITFVFLKNLSWGLTLICINGRKILARLSLVSNLIFPIGLIVIGIAINIYIGIV